MSWKKILIHDDKPVYYKPVIIFAKNKVCYKWHRVSNGEDEYYCSQDTDAIIPGEEVTHWRELVEPPK